MITGEARIQAVIHWVGGAEVTNARPCTAGRPVKPRITYRCAESELVFGFCLGLQVYGIRLLVAALLAGRVGCGLIAEF
jgi:hypothetical protein